MKINWREVWIIVRSVLVTGGVAAIGVWIAQIENLVKAKADDVVLCAALIAAIKLLQKLAAKLYPGELTLPAAKK